MGCNIVLRILLATFFEATCIYLFEENNLYLEQFGLLYPPHYCWEERKHSLFLGFIWQDEQNQNKFSRWNFFQKPFPPFPFPSSLSSFNLIEIVNQGTNRGIFIPSLLLKNTCFSLHLLKRCVLRCEAVTENEDTSVSLSCTALYKTLHRESKFDNFFCNLLTDFQNIEIGVIKRMALTIV